MKWFWSLSHPVSGAELYVRQVASIASFWNPCSHQYRTLGDPHKARYRFPRLIVIFGIWGWWQRWVECRINTGMTHGEWLTERKCIKTGTNHLTLTLYNFENWQWTAVVISSLGGTKLHWFEVGSIVGCCVGSSFFFMIIHDCIR